MHTVKVVVPFLLLVPFLADCTGKSKSHQACGWIGWRHDRRAADGFGTKGLEGAGPSHKRHLTVPGQPLQSPKESAHGRRCGKTKL